MKKGKRNKPSNGEIDLFFLSGKGIKKSKKESEQFERVKSSDIGRFVVLCLAEEKKKEKRFSLTNTAVGRQCSVVCTRRVVSDLEEERTIEEAASA